MLEFFKKRGIVGAAGGFWAMIPDIDYFLAEPVFKNAAWNDIFLFHSSFDKVLPETDLFFAAEMLLLCAVVNLFAIAATVESFKRLSEAIFGKKEEEEEEEKEEEEEETNGPKEEEEEEIAGAEEKVKAEEEVEEPAEKEVKG